MVTILSIIATILSMFGQYLIGNKSKWTFPVWIIANILWIFVNIFGTFNLWQIITFTFYTIMSVRAWFQWSK